VRSTNPTYRVLDANGKPILVNDPSDVVKK
jgi:hypothetical protein